MLPVPSQTGGPILWPLGGKLRHPLFLQQRPRANQGLLPPKRPVNMPWNAVSSRVGEPDTPTAFPSVVHQMMPIAITEFGFIGISRDSTGTALGGCTVKLYRETDDALMETTTSDANGNYRFKSAAPVGVTYYVRWYLAGSPDRAGTSKNGLVPA